MPNICFYFVELAVRLKKRNGRREVQNLMAVMFDVSADAKELRRHVRRVEDGHRLGTERSRNALNGEKIQKETMKRAGGGPDCSALLYEKSILTVLEEPVLSLPSHSFF